MSYKIPHLAMRMVRERTMTVASTQARSSSDVAAIAHKLIGNAPVEHVIAILVDGRANVTGVTTVAIGGMHGAALRPADVLRAVLAGQASAFILSHNHPSGDPKPSGEDVAFTDRIRAAADVVGVPLLDHVIVTRDPQTFSSVP